MHPGFLVNGRGVIEMTSNLKLQYHVTSTSALLQACGHVMLGLEFKPYSRTSVYTVWQEKVKIVTCQHDRAPKERTWEVGPQFW